MVREMIGKNFGNIKVSTFKNNLIALGQYNGMISILRITEDSEDL